MEWKPDQLTEVGCDYCDSTSAVPEFTRPDEMTVVRCTGCGLVYLSPRPGDRFVEGFYCEDYFEKESTASAIGYSTYYDEANRQGLILAAQRKATLLSRHIGLAGSTWLEVGCASGEFAQVVAGMGGDVDGIDLSESAISVAKQRYPSLSFEAMGVDALEPTRKYDVICAFEVIEHVTSPREFLGHLVRHLKPGGYLVFSTPNLECGLTVGYSKWVGALMSFEHLYYFDRASLARYAVDLGLKEVEWYTGGMIGDQRCSEFRGGFDRLKNKLRVLGQALWHRYSIRLLMKTTYTPQGRMHNLLVVYQKGG